jgi:hypothetical protein
MPIRHLFSIFPVAQLRGLPDLQELGKRYMVTPKAGAAPNWETEDHEVAKIFEAKPGGSKIRRTAQETTKRHRFSSGKGMSQSSLIIRSITKE